MSKFLLIFLLLLNLIFNTSPVKAETLTERIATYPNWQDKLELPTPQQDLIYPHWFAGKWQVRSQLVEQIAPLAPDFVTPGFDNNQQYLNEDIQFKVKFIPSFPVAENKGFIPSLVNTNQVPIIIADRQFNSLQITQAYLKDRQENQKPLEIKVIVNPKNANEQMTEISADNQLVSTIIGRKQETISETEFLTSELTRQFFRRPFSVYLNLVETTTKYQLINSRTIKADQFTAIYLSPEDPDYFQAKNQPVALYHYLLTLDKLPM